MLFHFALARKCRKVDASFVGNLMYVHLFEVVYTLYKISFF